MTETEPTTDDPLDQIAVDCNGCEWTLTIADIMQHIEDGAAAFKPTNPDRIRSKMGSLREGHAYFNRDGHRIKPHLSVDEIKQALEDSDQ